MEILGNYNVVQIAALSENAPPKIRDAVRDHDRREMLTGQEGVVSNGGYRQVSDRAGDSHDPIGPSVACNCDAAIVGDVFIFVVGSRRYRQHENEQQS